MAFTHVNHYVPQWYQRRFLDQQAAEQKLYYLDLHPDKQQRADGGFYYRNELRRMGPVGCFAESDLYTLLFGQYASDVVEKRFFGKIDSDGAQAISFFEGYSLREGAGEAWNALSGYLSAQALRTPKGIDFLKRITRQDSHQAALYTMRQLFQMHVTIWTEGVWEVIRCDNSSTKFIITDHPVTTYNRKMFPRSSACAYPFDAPIELLGTQTLFPLSLNGCLVITNLGYVRDPWANPLRRRENPRYFAQAMFDLRRVQTGRQITEHEVLAINYIVKQRARRYVAAGVKEWLYPEKCLPSRKWDKLGGRFFLMPDPRKVDFHTQTLVGYKDGSAWGCDEYGRHPGDNGLAIEALREREWRTFQRAKQSWDQEFGELSAEELRAAFW